VTAMNRRKGQGYTINPFHPMNCLSPRGEEEPGVCRAGERGISIQDFFEYRFACFILKIPF